MGGYNSTYPIKYPILFPQVEVQTSNEEVRSLDYFDRADGNLGISDSSQRWETIGATLVIKNCKVTTPTAAFKKNVLQSLISDGKASVKITFAGDGGVILIFRLVDTDNFFYISISGGVYRIYRNLATVFSERAVSTIIANANDLIEVTFKGSSIYLRINKVLAATYVDTNFLTATKHGIGNNFTVNGMMDNFKVVKV
jgi:hypothetical protein